MVIAGGRVEAITVSAARVTTDSNLLTGVSAAASTRSRTVSALCTAVDSAGPLTIDASAVVGSIRRRDRVVIVRRWAIRVTVGGAGAA
jgi:uncharacterized protein (DUF362 family)